MLLNPRLPLLTIDLENHNLSADPIRVTQGDIGLIQPIVFVQDTGKYTIGADNIKIIASKPDGKVVDVTDIAKAETDGPADFSLKIPDEMFTADGLLSWHVQVTDGNVVGTTIIASSEELRYIVEPQMANGTQSSDASETLAALQARMTEALTTINSQIDHLMTDDGVAATVKAAMDKVIGDVTAAAKATADAKTKDLDALSTSYHTDLTSLEASLADLTAKLKTQANATKAATDAATKASASAKAADTSKAAADAATAKASASATAADTSKTAADAATAKAKAAADAANALTDKATADSASIAASLAKLETDKAAALAAIAADGKAASDDAIKAANDKYAQELTAIQTQWVSDSAALKKSLADQMATVQAAMDQAVKTDLPALEDTINNIKAGIDKLELEAPILGVKTADGILITAAEGVVTLPDFAKKADIPAAPDLSGYVTKADLETAGKVKTVNGEDPDDDGNITITIPAAPDLTPYATTSAIAEFITKDDADLAYQPKGQYATTIEMGGLSTAVKAGLAGAETASHAAATYQPKGNYATKSDIPAAPDLTPYVKTTAIADMETKTHAAATFQPKGAYATTSAIASFETAAHAASAYQPKGAYATTAALASYALKTAIPAAPDLTPYVKTTAIADMETKTHAAATYQPKGAYATTAQLATTVKTINGKKPNSAGDVRISIPLEPDLTPFLTKAQITALITTALGGADGIKFDGADGSTDNYIHFAK